MQLESKPQSAAAVGTRIVLSIVAVFIALLVVAEIVRPNLVTHAVAMIMETMHGMMGTR